MHKFIEAVSSRFRTPSVERPVVLAPHAEALRRLMDRGVIDAIDQAIGMVQEQDAEEAAAYPHFELNPGGVNAEQLATLWIRISPRAKRYKTNPELIERWESIPTIVDLFPASVTLNSLRTNGDSNKPTWYAIGFPDKNNRKNTLVDGFCSAFRGKVFMYAKRHGVHQSSL